MRRHALALASVGAVLFASSAARADDSPLSFGVGVLGAFGGNFLGKPSDKTITVPMGVAGCPTATCTGTDDSYPGFSGTTSGYGASIEARLLGLVGLEIDAIHLSGKGTGDISLTHNGQTYGYSGEIDTTAWHVPVLVKGVIPLPLVAPFAFVGREFVFPSTSSASVTANPGSPPLVTQTTGFGDNYAMWAFGLGAEIKLPLPAIDLRIPVAIRGGYNPSVSDHVQDRVKNTYAANGAITSQSYDTTWQYQVVATVGAQLWF